MNLFTYKSIAYRLFRFGWIAVLLMTALLLITSSDRAVAQDTKTVEYDKPVTGQITDTNLTDTWTLTATASDVLSITVERQDGTLVPNVEVRRGDGEVIAHADHDAPAARASLPTIQLHGTYTLVVGRYQDKAGKTSGAYKLTVALLGAGPETGILPPFLIRALTIKVTLTNEHWGQAFIYPVGTGTHQLVTVNREAGTLIPTITLFEPMNGSQENTIFRVIQTSQVVQQVDANPDGASATLDFTAPTAPDPTQMHPYVILVARRDHEKGVTTGSFRITFKLLGRGPYGADDAISNGYTKMGSQSGVLDSIWQQNWVLKVDSLTPLTISASRTNGNLIPSLKIIAPNGQELANSGPDETFAKATISKFTPPAPDEYKLAVFRQGREAGVTEGEYKLTITNSQ